MNRRRLEVAGAWLLAVWVAYPPVGLALELLPGAPVLVFPGPAPGAQFLGWAGVLVAVLALRRRLFPALLGGGRRT